jgi:hypothetical protein
MDTTQGTIGEVKGIFTKKQGEAWEYYSFGEDGNIQNEAQAVDADTVSILEEWAV